MDKYSELRDKYKIEDFRKLHNWNKLEKKYYSDLSFFVDLCENIVAIRRKKSIPKDDALKSYTYSICYFDESKKLIRVDELGNTPNPKETFLIYSNNNLTGAFTFRLGFHYGRKVSKKIELFNLYNYEYKIGKLISMVNVSFPDPDYWGNKGDEYRLRYEYDKKGLLKIWKWSSAHPLLEEWVVIYDRERKKLLKTCTVSSSSYISKFRKTKKPPIFKREYYESSVKHLPICHKCKKSLSYLGYVNMIDERIKRKTNLQKIPAFYCFDCLEGSTFSLKSKSGFKAVAENPRLFPEQQIDFVRSNNKEDREEALVKVGGLPDWIQNDEWPNCGECKKAMIFVFQLNTSEEISNGKDVQSFGDSGKLYIFTHCQIVTSIVQYY